MSDIPQIAFVGIRRSGNHILIEWVAKHYRSVRHFNDCVIKKPGLYVTQGPQKKYQGYGDQDALFYSFEERSVDDAEKFLEEHGDQFDKVYFILRDAYNWGSSLMIGRGSRELRDTIKVWKRIAKLCEDSPDDFLLYDKFVTEPSYIQEVKDRHGLTNAPDALPSSFPKSGIGHGSSFDSRFPSKSSNFVNRDRNVKKHFKGKPPQAWKTLIADSDVSRLNQLIFGRSSADLDQ